MNEKRSFFDGRLSAVLVAAGSSVGLGNIWRFPYVAGSNGGGAFVLVYIGSLNFFDQLDFLTANILLPLGGLATCIFAGWVLDRKILAEQMHSGTPRTTLLSGALVVLLRWICPVLLVMIFLHNLHLI